MKAIITQALSVAVLSTVVIGGWYVFIKPEPAHSPFEVFVEKDEPSTAGEVTESLTPLEVAEASEPEELSEPVNVPGNYEYFDEEGISAAAAEEFRQLSVLPYNPKVATCEDAWINEDGINQLTYRQKCQVESKYPEHPYFDYPIENLVDMTRNADPLAAAVLAEKLKEHDPQRSMALALYSGFISGKPAQLLELVDKNFPIEKVDSLTRNRNVMGRYLMTSVAKKLGHTGADLSFASNLGADRLAGLEDAASAMFQTLKNDADAGLPLISENDPFVSNLNPKPTASDNN
jgi:hypothetical protein